MKSTTIEEVVHNIVDKFHSLSTSNITEIDSSEDYIEVSEAEEILEDELGDLTSLPITFDTMQGWKEEVIKMLPDNIGMAKQIEIEEIINSIK